MTRDEFVALLDRAVADGTISRAEAVELLDAYDRGELDGLLAPLPPGELTQRLDSDLVLAAIAALLLLLPRGRQTAAGLTTVTLAGRIELIDQMQAVYEANARTLARQLARREITLQQWQAAMREQVSRHLVQQTVAGSGSAQLTEAQLLRIQAEARRQAGFLGRFADTISVQQARGQPLSEVQIANRAESYAGVGRGAGFAAAEEAELEQLGEEYGWVSDYISRDDASTCIECLDAERNGPYLPGQGPQPGAVCLGRSRCRCRRELRYDPAAYEALAGVRRAA